MNPPRQGQTSRAGIHIGKLRAILCSLPTGCDRRFDAKLHRKKSPSALAAENKREFPLMSIRPATTCERQFKSSV
jgi:hypothetical protein